MLESVIPNDNLMQLALAVKESLHALADQFPDDATWKDVLYEAYTRQEIAMGLEEARRGDFAKDENVTSAFAKWGVTITTQVD